MTPAVQELKRKGINFKLHSYQHDASANSYGLEAAEKLQLPPEQVFKTLVISTDSNVLAVAILPITKKLNLKLMAKALQVKKVKMADAKNVQTSTGYVLGGVSPLGQKRRLKTIIDSSCKTFDIIYISGGKRGLEVEMSPSDLHTLLQASILNITEA